MSVLTVKQLNTAALEGGWLLSEERAKAIAIALAESGGRTDATHSNSNGSTDYGLWQINSIHKDILARGSWSNPIDNARMARQVYENAGKSFTPWSVYKSGRYLAFLSVARQAALGSESPLPPVGSGGTSGTGSGGGVSTSGGTAQLSGLPLPNPFAPVEAIKKLVQVLTDPSTYIRAAMLFAGATLIYMGLRAMSTIDNKILDTAKDAALLAATRGAGKLGKAGQAVRAVA